MLGIKKKKRKWPVENMRSYHPYIYWHSSVYKTVGRGLARDLLAISHAALVCVYMPPRQKDPRWVKLIEALETFLEETNATN